MQLNQFEVEYQEYYVANDYIYTLAINQNLRLLAFGGKTLNVIILDLSDEQIYQTLEKTHIQPVLCLNFSQNNRLFQFGFDNFFVIYTYKNKKFLEPEIIQTPNIKHRYAILTNNDNTIISVGDTNVISIYNLVDRQIQSIILPTHYSLTCITTNYHKQLATCSGNNSHCFINIQQQRVIFKEKINSSFYIKMSNNNQLFAEGRGSNINIKSSINKKLIRKQLGDSDFCVLIIKFTKDDQFLLAGSMDFSVTIYNVCQGRLNKYENHESYVFSLEFQDQNENVIYTGSRDFRIGKWIKKSC